MRDELDELLRTELLAPPAGFGDRVLAAMACEPEPTAAGRAHRRDEWLEWLALAGAVLAGGPQLALFLFGVWTVSGAG